MKNIVRNLSYIEGTSLLFLLFVAMPMKYIGGDPTLVRVVGMGHGMLYASLMMLLVYTATFDHWPKKLFWFAVIACSLPFGMFFFDRKLAGFYSKKA